MSYLSLDKRKELAVETTVGDLIEVLKEYPKDAAVNICGSAGFFIHSKVDDEDPDKIIAINIDWDSLDSYYLEQQQL